MSDIILFLRVGWNNAWKNKTVFLFAALALSGNLYPIAPTEWRTPSPSVVSLLFLLGSLCATILLVPASIAGMAYTAYCAVIDQPAPLSVTWAAVKNCWRRMIGLSCLALGVLFLAMCLLIVVGIGLTGTVARASGLLPSRILGMVVGALSGLWYFALFGIVARNLGIRESLRAAWTRFADHFWTAASVGVTGTAAWWLCDFLISVGLLLMKSRIGTVAWGDVSYVNPGALLAGYWPYHVATFVLFEFFAPFTMAIFAGAYLRYGTERVPAD